MSAPDGMTFLWPALLWLLLAIPALAALYGWLHLRRKRAAARHASLTLETAGRAPGRLQRALPPLLLLVGLAAMIFAVARPHALVALPTRHEAVILALDVSGSMRATDVKPNRLAAAQSAAKSFIAGQPRHVRIGLVVIAAAAAVAQSPTDNREDLYQALDRVQLQRGSALGAGLILSLATLLPDAGLDVEQLTSGRPVPPWMAQADKKLTPVPPGSNGSVAIVLLSDGQSNVGPDPLEAAKLAAEHGVRVYTVGLGTTEGVALGFKGWSMRVRLDEEILTKIALMTRGEYLHAEKADDLKRIYRQLETRLSLDRKRTTEVTALFAAAGALLAALGAMCSLFWFNRIL
jgi:Ca-activated chloride channel family protein